MKTLSFALISILFTLTLFSQSQADSLNGWEKLYGQPGVNEVASDMIELSDKSILSVGFTAGSNTILQDNYVIKLDSFGNKIWQRVFGGAGDQELFSIVETHDNHYLLAGYTSDSSSGKDFSLIKMNHNGNILWSRTYGGTSDDICRTVLMTKDNHFLLAGTTESFGAGNEDAYLIKVDSNGTPVWTQTYGHSSTDILFDIVENTDSTFSFTGRSLSRDTLGRVWYSHVSSSGAVLLDTCFILTPSNKDPYGYIGGRGITTTSDSNLYICGSAPHNFNFSSVDFLMKIEKNGTIIWNRENTGGYYGGYHKKVVEMNNNIYVVGYDFNFGGYGAIFQYNSNGIRTWKKTTPVNIQSPWNPRGNANNISVSSDQHLLVAAQARELDITWYANQAHLIKIDKNKTTFNNRISGTVYNDANLNCTVDAGESQNVNRYKNSLVIRPGVLNDSISYIPVGNNGNYEFYAGTGTYELTYTPSPFFELQCGNPQGKTTVTFSGNTNNSSGNNFAVTVNDTCYYAYVDIASSILRPCRDAYYIISYGNYGTASVNNSYVEATLPEGFQVTSSSLPYTNTGNVFSFQTGSINPNSYSSIKISGTVSCLAQQSEFYCSKVEIFPKETCNPVDSAYDNSNLIISSECINDSAVVFTVYNNSPQNSNMMSFSEWRLYDDSLLVRTDSLQLSAGDSSIFTFPLSGSILRMEVDQSEGHPFSETIFANSYPCGTVPTNNTYLSYFSDFDEQDFIEYSCTEIRNSYDPNDKQVHPSGATSSNLTSSSEVLEYTIRFQNIGNDTAFNIKVIDTIDIAHLNINSLVPGVSSHDYTFKLFGNGLAEWYFENIQLVDSNTNEPLSHGFIKYKIDQNSGNQQNDIIRNTADIYFDFNSPITTNTVINTVFDTVYKKIPGDLQLQANISQLSVCQNDSLTGSSIASSGAAPYAYEWSIDSTVVGNDSSLSLINIADTGNFTLKLSVSDKYSNRKDTSFQVLSELTPVADFDFLANSFTVDFHDSSEHVMAANYSWSFGDGNTSTVRSPTHTYSNNATYQVCLSLQNSNLCSDSICKSVTILSTGVLENESFSFEIYPNPAQESIIIKGVQKNEQNTSIRLFSPNGKVITDYRVSKGQRFNYSVGVAHLARGVYFIEFQTEKEIVIKKIILN